MFTGAKGSSSSFKQTPDNLRSNDTFEGVLGMGIGPMKGPTRGLKSIKMDGTAIENETGDLNFQDFAATFGDGDPLKWPQAIQLKLGAGAAPTQVGTSLTNTTGSNPVWSTHTLNNTNADFIDLRFIVQQLFRQDSKGIYDTTATLEINMKPVGSTTWINPTIGTATTNYSQTGFVTNGINGAQIRVYLPESYYNDSGVPLPGNSNYKITGKTSSASVYELRISVPNTGSYANTAWDIRVRLLERDSFDDGNGNQEKRTVSWESMAAVYSTVLGNHEDWRGSAWLQLYGKASDQLTGVPEVTGEYDCKIVSVPPTSVFNPDTRQYTTALWDGSWAKAWTNDPAWVINDAISDELAGISLLAPGSYLNKWDALDLSKYCSTLVPDGNGGTEPRFCMNISVTEVQKAEEFIRYLAGAVGALAWDQGDGEWRCKVDKNDNPVDLFTLENIEGEFVYSGTDTDTRYNDIIGQFKNAEMDYRQDAVHLYDNVSIAQIGRKPTTIALVGCTGRQEAMRRVKLRIRSTVNENKIVNFTTNRRGRNIEQLSTILIADADLGDQDKRTTGRMVGFSTDRKMVMFRDPLYLAPGITYTLRFTIPNPDYNPETSTQPTSADWTKPTIVLTYNIVNTSAQRGPVTTIYLDQALPDSIDPNANVALDAPSLPTVPALFRVTNVSVGDDGERIAISGIIIDTGKQAASDNVSKEDTVFQDLRGAVVPPTTLTNQPLLSLVRVPIEQGSQVNLQANWIRPAGAFISGFRIQYSVNGGALQTAVERQQLTEWELPNAGPGIYHVEVCTIDRRGGYSLPLSGDLEVTQSLIDATQIFYNTGGGGSVSLQDRMPAQAGADVTAQNTANDTTHLGGRTTTSVLAALDNASSGGSVDLTPVYQAITDAETQADQHLAAAQSTLSTAIGTADAKAVDARTRADAAQALALSSDQALNTPSTGVTAQIGQIQATLTTPTTGVLARLTTLQSTFDTPTTGVLARIANTETILTNPSSGLVNRTSSLETTVNTPNSGVLARITALESTAGDDSGALVARVNNLDAQINTGSGSIVSHLGTVENLVSNPTTGLVNRTTTLESQLGGVGGVNARLSTVESTLTTPGSGIVSRTQTLEARANGGGNLVGNSSFNTLDGWLLSFNADNAEAMTLNRAGAAQMLGGIENNLTLYRAPAGSGFNGEAISALFAITPNAYYQVSGVVASHRSNAWVSMYFYDTSGNSVGYAGENLNTVINAGGQNPANWETIGNKCYQAPTNAVSGRFVFRHYNTTADGYAWLSRPMVTQVQAGANTWAVYAPGNDRDVVSVANAKLTTLQTVVGDATGGLVKQTTDLSSQLGTTTATANAAYTATTSGQFALSSTVSSLSATLGTVQATANNANTAISDGRFAAATSLNTLSAQINGTGGLAATVSQNASVVATLNGKLYANLTLAADAGNGRAQISLRADSYGSAGVDVIGDVIFKGKLAVIGANGGAGLNIVGNLITGYYSNGNMAFRLGVVS